LSFIPVKELRKKYQVRPSKGLGQNFLIDNSELNKIIDSADLKENDVVLEIGPGTGNLTQELVKRVKTVIAVEKDPQMIEILKKTFRDFTNIEIVQGDILKIKELKIKNYKIVANLPFYLTAPVIRKFLEVENPPKEMILVIQKEVAQRICVKTPDMNLLAISVQFYAYPKIISYISKKSFWPKPKVDSAIIRIIPKEDKEKDASRDLFFKIVKAGFSQPRKQILNNLSSGLKIEKGEIITWLLQNNIKPAQRAETLEVGNWIKLAKSFKI
jgi:16S rRNA (adenine1518-N6/adenine1519-N6)-dimethyltransferase